MTSYTPYKISIPDKDLDLLKQKLSLARFPDELEGAGYALGSPLTDVQRLTKYWREEYDWRKAEQRLNDQLPQFMTKIEVSDGFGEFDIHFVYQKSKNPNAVPLLFLHGWPGSFIEVAKILDYLKVKDENEPAFDVVAPSLPNFGFSSGAKKRGFSLRKYAEVCHKLMLSLGYFEYVTQGGDWGCFISRVMGKVYPEAVKASHINFIMAGPWNFVLNPHRVIQQLFTPLSSAEWSGLKASYDYLTTGSGYTAIQSTRPQSLSYSLEDSPIGLLGWLWEKLHDWTDEYPWKDEEIITWVSIYWFSTAGPGASIRIYNEAKEPLDKSLKPDFEFWNWVPKIPLGLIRFPKDILLAPRIMGRTMGPVVHETIVESGGHFAAWERPKELADDLKKMFGYSGGAYGVVYGRAGYFDSDGKDEKKKDE